MVQSNNKIFDSIQGSSIEKDNLSDWSPESLPMKMTSGQVVEMSVLNLRTPITQVIFFNQGTLLLGSNHFLI